MIIQPVVNIAEICAQHGVEHVVLSPGSRCAPLTIAFNRNPQFQVKTVSDERAAAFIALGMALTTGKPVVLICTSGTAALNYAPAVAEAFYQQVPLLVLTADRPPEWIDQLDGQTIRQQQIYGQHIKQSYSFPVDFSTEDAVWHSERMVSEALNITKAFPAGPVHINVPLREPFYPAVDEEIQYDSTIKVIRDEQNDFILTTNQQENLQHELASYNRILVLAGQGKFKPELLKALKQFSESTGAVVVGDLISNVHELPEVIRHQDAIFSTKDETTLQSLQPELVISFGKSVISKSLKLYLRKYKPKAQWHLQEAGQVADTFQSLTRIIRCEPGSFFNSFRSPHPFGNKSFLDNWQSIASKASDFLNTYTSTTGTNELTIVAKVLQHLPAQSNLHLANSMAVRYANFIGLPSGKGIQVFANRGTSGIDGSTSTAVGCALTSSKITTIITGDMAFFYDRNALWHNYLPANLRIVILNNHAGGIFRLIDGPRQQPELEEFFETKQALKAENTARDFNMTYTSCQSLTELEQVLPAFFAPESGAGILEVFTDSKANAASFAQYKKELVKYLG